jgi:hypothetical protein|tara:strand:- start:1763 stop:2368 length:606 start_codon:yes stop_codon:yes gene_type:complete
MATGYTYQILNGSIKTFKEFALKCSEAFIIEFRDGAKKYTPRVPSPYHTDEMKAARAGIAQLNQLTDSELFIIEVAKLEKGIRFAKEELAKKIKNKKVLDKILEESKEYETPTDRHKNIKNFMIEQLNMTIESDCDSKFYESEIALCQEKLKNLDMFVVRGNKINAFNEDYKYHQERYDKEVLLCKDHNDWYNQFVTSLDD